MIQLYVGSADIVFEDDNNEITAYFFENKITLVIRPWEINQSYIALLAYDEGELIQDAIDFYEGGQVDVIRGNIQDVRKRGKR